MKKNLKRKAKTDMNASQYKRNRNASTAAGYPPDVLRAIATGNVNLNPANRGLHSRGAEVKAVDVPLTLVNLSTTETLTLLNGVQEGSSFYQRIGRRIEMKNIHFVGNMDTTPNAAGVDDYIRIMILYDQQPGNALPSKAEILQDVDNTGTITNTSYSGLNLNNRDRFTVLMDHRIGLARDGGAATDGVTEIAGGSTAENANTSQFNRFINLKGLLTQYKASSSPAVIGDIATGALYLFTLGKIVTATSGYNLAFKTRLRYKDT